MAEKLSGMGRGVGDKWGTVRVGWQKSCYSTYHRR